MPDARSHSHRALPNALRFPRVATFAAAGYLALATVDFAAEAVRPTLPRAEPTTPTVRSTTPTVRSTMPTVRPTMLPDAAATGAPTAAVFPPRAFSSSSSSFPSTEEDPAPAHGVASWYGRRFHGLPTASGERFDMHGYTAAHRTLPFGTPVEVRNPRNGRAVVVRINDRGPHSRRRAIDLSYAAARDLGIAARGTADVELRVLR